MVLGLLLAAQLASAPTPAPRPATFATFTTSVDVLAFSDDGTQALLQETTTAGATTKTTLLILDRKNEPVRLPISDRTQGIRKDRVSRDVCEASADRVSAVARDFRGISVVIGLCGSVDRDVVTALQQPKPRVLSQEIGAIHTKVGFAGRVFIAERGPLIVVVGEDFFGNARVGVTEREP